jgi:hypothetical protein
MFRISPSKKDTIQPPATTVAAAPIDPVTRWMNDYNFAFPPTLTTEDVFHHQDARFKEIRELPKVGYPLYHLISQYNPWLDCEMTREKRAFLAPKVGEFCCPVYVGGGGGTDHLSRNVPSSIFRNETVIDIVNLYLWPLLHSRADDVIACRTFAEWQRLFSQTISLAFPDYEYWKSVAAGAGAGATAVFIPISDQRRTAQILKYMTPARVLYLLTTRAGLWPYGPSSSSSSSSPPPTTVRYTSISTRSSSSRSSFGLCSIKPKIKEYTDRTEIEWLVGADFLRKMKRVHIYFTISITTNSNASVSSSVYDTDESSD